MFSKYTLIATGFLFASCNNNHPASPAKPGRTNDSSTVYETTKQTGNDNQTGNASQNAANGFWEKLQMNELRDQNGMVAAVMPLPASWKLMAATSPGGPSITGPGGIKITDFPARSFMFNYNASLQGAYSQGGQQMRAMPGIEQLVQQDFVPWAASQGLRLVRYYEIPEVTKMDKWYSEQLFKAMPGRADVAAIGTEWKSGDDRPYFLLVHINVSTSQQMQTWYYMSSGLEAESAVFDAAKKQYIFGLANTRYNLQPIVVYNQQEAQRVGQSWAAHNQRMAQNQANFEASQRAFVNKSDAINHAIMSGWRERNAAGDKQQEQFLDVIKGQDNVVDPTTGQGYKVEAGANNYWMNNNGEYIGTQLQGYDPNLDKNMEPQKWQELQPRKD